MPASDGCNIQGISHLVVGSDFITGHLLNEPVRGLKGTIATNPPELHRCCVPEREQVRFWDIEILDYSTGEQLQIPNVLQKDALNDLLTLTTDYSYLVESTIEQSIQFSFETQRLKVDQEALHHLNKYFKIPFSSEIHVCIGPFALINE